MNASFKKLINGDKPILIDFFAEWCGPCKAMEPTVKSFASKHKETVRVIKIDIDKNHELAQKLNVRGVPTFMLFNEGEMLWRQSGGMTETQLEQVLQSKIF